MAKRFETQILLLLVSCLLVKSHYINGYGKNEEQRGGVQRNHLASQEDFNLDNTQQRVQPFDDDSHYASSHRADLRSDLTQQVESENFGTNQNYQKSNKELLDTSRGTTGTTYEVGSDVYYQKPSSYNKILNMDSTQRKVSENMGVPGGHGVFHELDGSETSGTIRSSQSHSQGNDGVRSSGYGGYYQQGQEDLNAIRRSSEIASGNHRQIGQPHGQTYPNYDTQRGHENYQPNPQNFGIPDQFSGGSNYGQTHRFGQGTYTQSQDYNGVSDSSHGGSRPYPQKTYTHHGQGHLSNDGQGIGYHSTSSSSHTHQSNQQSTSHGRYQHVGQQNDHIDAQQRTEKPDIVTVKPNVHHSQRESHHQGQGYSTNYQQNYDDLSKNDRSRNPSEGYRTNGYSHPDAEQRTEILNIGIARPNVPHHSNQKTAHSGQGYTENHQQSKGDFSGNHNSGNPSEGYQQHGYKSNGY